MTEPTGRRPDLAAMLTPLLRAFIAAELPILEAHGISMWGYIVLGTLSNEPVRTQAALAQAIGADKSRIIGTLDELQSAGLIVREPDPADRRARLLAVTEEGRRIYQAAQAAIQANENRVLKVLSPNERQSFLNATRKLCVLPESDIVGSA